MIPIGSVTAGYRMVALLFRVGIATEHDMRDEAHMPNVTEGGLP
jgi:hypothetical protein